MCERVRVRVGECVRDTCSLVKRQKEVARTRKAPAHHLAPILSWLVSLHGLLLVECETFDDRPSGIQVVAPNSTRIVWSSVWVCVCLRQCLVCMCASQCALFPSDSGVFIIENQSENARH